MSARKIATSLPAEQYASLERVRRRLHLKRSEAVQEAVAMWLAAREGDDRVRRYIEGYMNRPEDDKDSAAHLKAWSRGLDLGEWE